MKILLSTHQFLPEHSSGTEILVYKVAKELQHQGHEIIVFTAKPTKMPLGDDARFDQYEHDGISVRRFHHEFAAFGGQSNIIEMEYDSHLVARFFFKLLATEKPDVVHFFHLGRLSSSPIPECHKYGIPAFYTPTDFWAVCPTNQLRLPNGKLCNGPDQFATNCVQHLAGYRSSTGAHFFSHLPHKLAELLVRAASYRAASNHSSAGIVNAVSRRLDIVVSRLNSLEALFVPSRIMETMLERNGVKKNKMRFFPYGLDLSFEIPIHREFTADCLRVGFIGTLSEHKGVHLLIKALKLIPDINIELLIYGNLSDYPSYVAQLHELSVDSPRIKFLGTFPNTEIGQVFSNIDVLAVPSVWYENTPLVIYSAQACGCPVIASRLGGMSEIVEHEKNGLTFTAGDIQEISAALDRLYKDRSLLKRLSENCRPPRTISNYASELVEIYLASIIARGRSV